MNKLFATATILLLSSISHADIIKCGFTEPFVSSTYSTTQSTLTYFEYGGHITTVLKNISFQIKGPGVFELVDNKGKVIQTLTLNNQGSDGMSDTVYPYEVKDHDMKNMANSGVGGCSSNYLKTKLGDDSK